jgi:hypothetical protein
MPFRQRVSLSTRKQNRFGGLSPDTPISSLKYNVLIFSKALSAQPKRRTLSLALPSSFHNDIAIHQFISKLPVSIAKNSEENRP